MLKPVNREEQSDNLMLASALQVLNGLLPKINAINKSILKDVEDSEAIKEKLHKVFSNKLLQERDLNETDKNLIKQKIESCVDYRPRPNAKYIATFMLLRQLDSSKQ